MEKTSWTLFALFPAMIFLGFALLFLKGYPTQGTDVFAFADSYSWVPWLFLVFVLAVFVQFVMVHSSPKPNLLLFPTIMLLASVGIVMLARLKPELLVPQLRWLFIGMLVFIIILRFGRFIVASLNYPYILGLSLLVLLALPFLFGTEIGGSRNWLTIGSLRVQPSEFGKILLVLFLTAYLYANRQVLSLTNSKFLFLSFAPLKYWAPLICLWSIAILMFVLQKDLGAALIFYGVTILMVYMATGKKSYIFVALVLLAVSSFAGYMEFPHVKQRFDIWWDPFQDPDGASFQLIRALISLGAGGVWGTGFAHGQPELIPEVHTDFIFAAFAEEFGLAGSLMLMLAYALLFYEGIVTALACPTEETSLLAAGCNMVFFWEAFLIIAGTTKFLPLTGIPLPFISYGGSSMVSSFILFGILLTLSRKQAPGA